MAVMEQKHQGRLPIFKIFADEGSHPAVQLDRPICVVGRREGTNLPLDAEQVSKFHALIVRDTGGVYLRDLASTNGVQLNGQPVSEAELTDEDTIRIGAFTLQCASGFSDGRENGAARSDASSPGIELLTDGNVTPAPAGRHSFIIGRRASCEVRLNDASVAPVHAALFKMDGQWMVRAFSTPGGTKLNGASVHQSALSPGDELTIGETTFTIRLNDSASVASDDSLFDSDLGLVDSALPTPGDSFAAEALSTPGVEPVLSDEPSSNEDSAELSAIDVVAPPAENASHDASDEDASDEDASEASDAHNAVADDMDDESDIPIPVDSKTNLNSEDSDSLEDDIVASKASRFNDVSIVDDSAEETSSVGITPDLMDDSGFALQGELVDSSPGHASFTGEVIAERKGPDAPVAPVAPKISPAAPREKDSSSGDRQKSNAAAKMSASLDDLLPVEHAAAIPLSGGKDSPSESTTPARAADVSQESTDIAAGPIDPEDAGNSAIAESADLPPEERVEALVGEIADKAASLKEAWEELTTTEEPASTGVEQPGKPAEKKKRAPRKPGARKGRKSKES